jgi:hypothetical protein
MVDPGRIFRNARREALVVALVWALAAAWVVGYCYLRGYSHPADAWVVRAGLAAAGEPTDQGVILGFPSWVFWGILAPWLICTAFTVLYGTFGMPDDELGEDASDERSEYGH